jgi:uncharacterized Zn-binding protein involved in type VI secretion
LEFAPLALEQGQAQRNSPLTNGKRKSGMPQLQKNETTYLFATIGSITARGGRVSRVSTEAEVGGFALTCVGDVVTYGDGTQATILDGAGAAALLNDAPFALVGSSLSNGDRIAETLQDFCGIAIREGEVIPGLFDPGYVPPILDSTSGEGGHA